MLEMEATQLRNDKEREVGTIRNEKQLLEMRMMMMQMQQQQQQQQQQHAPPPPPHSQQHPFAMGFRDHGEAVYGGPPIAFSGSHGNRFLNRWGNGVDGTGNGVDSCGNGVGGGSSGNGVIVATTSSGEIGRAHV